MITNELLMPLATSKQAVVDLYSFTSHCSSATHQQRHAAKQEIWVSVDEIDADLKLVFPVIAKIVRSDQDVFVAECLTLKLYVFANTYEETLETLKEAMRIDYNSFMSDYPDRLSEDAVDLLRVYCALLGRSLPETKV